MTASITDFASLMASALEAASKQNFKVAADIYQTIIDTPEMKDRVDLKVRYAFCLEKTGQLFESIKYYQEAIESCHVVKEFSVIKTLETKITVLRSLSKVRKPNEKKLSRGNSKTSLMNEASTREFQSLLDLGTRDLNQTGEKGGQGLAQALERSLSTLEPDINEKSKLEHTSYFTLGTTDFEHTAEDWNAETLDLSLEDKQS
ncbi:MAG: hypothetical protein R8M46_05005 [Ghiorsea sp.]